MPERRTRRGPPELCAKRYSFLDLRFSRHGSGAHRADAPDIDRAVPLQLMAAQRIELVALFDPAHHGLGYEDLASEVLGESLKSSGDVHRVADRRIIVPLRRSDVADGDRPVVDSDPDREDRKPFAP